MPRNKVFGIAFELVEAWRNGLRLDEGLPDPPAVRAAKEAQRRGLRPGPIAGLGPRPRRFLKNLSNPSTRNLRDALKPVVITWGQARHTLNRWLDEPAFVCGMWVTLSRLPRERADRILEAILLFVRSRPLQHVCDVPWKDGKPCYHLEPGGQSRVSADQRTK